MAPGDDADADPADDAALDALLDAYALKDERRTGWQLRGIDEPESVAAHSWGVAYLVLTLGDRFREDLPGVDRDRALRLAVVHDVAEAETGDVATRAADVATRAADVTADDDAAGDAVDREAKVAAEREAMRDLAGPLPERVRDAWEAYEARNSPEAVLVKECDLLDTCLQALRYERGDRYDPERGDPDAFREYDDLDEFFATSEPRLRTDAGVELFASIRERYRAARDR
ncbi:HD family hydrolase [Halorubrum ezzemoulense]|uniref:5'-deoxynucleotidase n=1 Tax=Halorubrum ezzemoulense TaxID=337243 RepID=A0ABT4Z4I0_HALEZ|nr:HD family hydrolase [Halorubrum ezzemoulense]MDB2245007.1 HD family hydrolase [Halorubrum ezzemoulense]MDB2251214.1 HD family hydrolase [Halorubrum ezzemoulense]MDB2278236.1 HD family hydrolase [Halorubrum ezzemoulense]MDB2284910.1 HD family hydrolase [Halorubrum ezzemoulense]MDB2288342.1 HD family hydrolase [Halorubrum ezzemoulense]